MPCPDSFRASSGTLYIGATHSLARRVYEHIMGAVEGFTKAHNVKQLVWFKETPGIQAALQREKNLKH